MGACLCQTSCFLFSPSSFPSCRFHRSFNFIANSFPIFIPRHFTLHRSWLHVLVRFPRSVFFPLQFMYRCYTAMITHALVRFHICTSHASSASYFITASASLLQLATTLPIFTSSYHLSSVANMNAVLSQHIDGLVPRLVFTFPSHTMDTGWPSLYGICDTKPCSSGAYLRASVP